MSLLWIIIITAIVVFLIASAIPWSDSGTSSGATRQINHISDTARSQINRASEEYLKRVRDNARR
jgi:hypothetical protein